MAVDIGMRNLLELYGADGTLIMRATDQFPRVEVFDGAGKGPLKGWSIPQYEPDAKEPHDYSSWPPHCPSLQARSGVLRQPLFEWPEALRTTLRDVWPASR